MSAISRSPSARRSVVVLLMRNAAAETSQLASSKPSLTLARQTLYAIARNLACR